MAAPAASAAPSPEAVVRPPRERVSSWPLLDRAAYLLCWLTGIALCLIAIGIVLYMFVKGISNFSFNLFTESEHATLTQSSSGGFKDALIGTLIVTLVGIAIAAPLGVAIATWVNEYGRPSWLARAVESALETLAGAPSIVLALFGLLVFSQGFLAFLSQGSSSGAVGESFLIAGITMSTIALPLVFAATRAGLAQLPDRTREASLALGKTRATTIRRVLLPSTRPSIASGIVLGMGRIIGDTAIIAILLGGTLRTEPVGHTPIISTLRGLGSTMTEYIYYNSPAGEGNAAQKAYVAAFVLLMIVLLLNAIVTRLTREPSERGVISVALRALEWSPIK